MLSVDEFYGSLRKFGAQNMYSLSILVGLFFIYLIVNAEEGFINSGEYPGVFSKSEKGAPAKKAQSNDDGPIIPTPKPLKQEPTRTMKDETNFLAKNINENSGDYLLLDDGMIPTRNGTNSQLSAERCGYGDIQGIVEGRAFQEFGQLDSGQATTGGGATGGMKASPSSKKITLKLIYAPWCGWSKKALPDFDKIMGEMNNKTINGVTIVVEKHNSDENKEIVKKYNVTGFPHYILEVYEGGSVIKTVKVQDRDYSGLKKVIMNNL